MELKSAVSKRLNELLEEKHCTVEMLAEKSKLSNATINRLLNGSIDRIIETHIFNICRALDISLHEFYDTPLLTLENLDDTRKIK